MKTQDPYCPLCGLFYPPMVEHPRWGHSEEWKKNPPAPIAESEWGNLGSNGPVLCVGSEDSRDMVCAVRVAKALGVSDWYRRADVAFQTADGTVWKKVDSGYRAPDGTMAYHRPGRIVDCK